MYGLVSRSVGLPWDGAIVLGGQEMIVDGRWIRIDLQNDEGKEWTLLRAVSGEEEEEMGKTVIVAPWLSQRWMRGRRSVFVSLEMPAPSKKTHVVSLRLHWGA